jgi:nitrite reductase/ring-hydroxylating ferredoxin subunit
MTKHVIATVDEIAPGGRKLVELKGREIAVFNIAGEFFAISNACPHEGASLCRGVLVGLAEADEPGKVRLTRKGEMLRCPWHGWEFDIRTGKSWCDPRRVRVKSYDIVVESGSTLVEGPYQVDTFAISIEDRYVVIDL